MAGKRTYLGVICAMTILFGWAIARKAHGQSDLQLTYGASGVQRLSYKGLVLEDLSLAPNDAFHIWHMKSTDLSGNVRTDAQYGWGENNNGKTWDAATHTWTYNFVWGSIRVQFAQNGNNLDMVVTTVNAANSGIIFDGATIYPFGLNFPQLPASFNDASYPQLAYNTTGPSVTVADFGRGEVVAVVPDATQPLYSGFWPTGNGIGYSPVISGTAPDNLATFQPHNDRPVQPGQTSTYTVSLRFAPSGTAAGSLAADAYASWAATYPPVLNWTDRRVIGTAFLASSPTGDVSQPGGYPNNPRRYFNDSNANDFDVTTAAGLAAFQAKVLAQAATNVASLKMFNAQGLITWDVEGEQYPQQTSYVCEPDEIAQAAPEMESTVRPGSPYAGMKLDDAYFKTMTDAGFRVGVCVRPQHFTLGGNGTAQQVYLPDASIAAELIRKIKYAHDRWGATLFYIDSTVESNGAVLDAGIFQQVAAAFPDSLLIPEESTPKYYAYTAPFKSFIDLAAVGTDPSVLSFYPHAFSAVLVNDVDPGKLAAALPQLTRQVKQGDILMGHADYWQANNPVIHQIYQSAGGPTGGAPVPASPPAPAQTSDSSGGSSGSASSGGTQTSSTGTQTSSTPDTPAQIAPAQSPTTTTQDNSPPDTPAPTAASATTDSSGGSATDSSSSAAPAQPVSNSSVAIVAPVSGGLVSGLLTVGAQMALSLDAAGSYLMVDGIEIGTRRVTGAPYLYTLDTTTLTNGLHSLQIWAHDIGNNTVLSSIVSVNVAN